MYWSAAAGSGSARCFFVADGLDTDFERPAIHADRRQAVGTRLSVPAAAFAAV